jgi:hypothetical protein
VTRRTGTTTHNRRSAASSVEDDDVESVGASPVTAAWSPIGQDGGRADERSRGGPMGVKQWIVELLSRGDAPDPDPDAPVELQTVAVPDAPLLVAALRDEGIHATAVDRFDPATALTRTRIMVRRADAPAALAALERRA